MKATQLTTQLWKAAGAVGCLFLAASLAWAQEANPQDQDAPDQNAPGQAQPQAQETDPGAPAQPRANQSPRPGQPRQPQPGQPPSDDPFPPQPPADENADQPRDDRDPADREQPDDQPADEGQDPRDQDQRGILGITFENHPDGVKVKGVIVGGAAQQAGVRPGDWIKSINGQEYQDANEAAQAIQQMKAGENVDILVMRNGREQQLQAKMAARNQFAQGDPGQFGQPGQFDGARRTVLRPDLGADAMRQMQQELAELRQQVQQLQQQVRQMQGGRAGNQPGAPEGSLEDASELPLPPDRAAPGQGAPGRAAPRQDAPGRAAPDAPVPDPVAPDRPPQAPGAGDRPEDPGL